MDIVEVWNHNAEITKQEQIMADRVRELEEALAKANDRVKRLTERVVEQECGLDNLRDLTEREVYLQNIRFSVKNFFATNDIASSRMCVERLQEDLDLYDKKYVNQS